MSFDDLHAQLRGALDQQLTALKQHYEQAQAEARRQAAADAEREAVARVQAARAEWDSAQGPLIEAARAEIRQQAEEAARTQRKTLEQELQQQLEQSVQQSRKAFETEIEGLRKQLQEDVQAERQRGETALQQALEAERQQAQKGFDAQRQQLQQALDGERQQLREALDGARQQLQQAIDAERQQLQQGLEAERQRADQATTERDQTKQALEAEAARSAQALDAERERAKAELETVQQLMEAEVASLQGQLAEARETAVHAAAQAETAAAQAAAADAAAAVAAKEASSARTAAAAKAAVPSSPSSSSALARLPDAVRALDAAASLRQTLDAWLEHSAAIAGRAAVFLVDGTRVAPWKTARMPDADVQQMGSTVGAGDLLSRAIETGESASASSALPAPAFARLAADRPAVAVPLIVGGRAVAVLYADAGAADPPAGWDEAVDLVTRHAAAVSALRTASRTLEMLRSNPSERAGGGQRPTGGDSVPNGIVNGNGEESARRYARLLVSEIKLYNEAAVRAGRQQRDLLQRLGTEIDRAQRLYLQRVPPAVGGRDQYFHQELVQTLADGDPSLLG